MKIENLCIKCMREKRSPGGVCEHCGFDPSTYQVPVHHMEPFSILAGKYLVGKAIGEGGFGITYIGMDLNLEMRVAIKEYYPNGFAVRDSGRTSTVQSCGGDAREFFEKGREKFIGEARNLAKCTDIPEIVRVKEFFKENETAYIVMEYVDGTDLKTYLKERGGRLSVQETLDMMRPLISALGKVHQRNLIHRDISPDNIMLLNNGNVKLLDFGGARDFVSSSGKSISITLKRGYAPGEQYRTHGEQGPWTDVYALCATMYRCITGVIPPESLDREHQDDLKPIPEFGIECPPVVERVLEKGLSVYKEGRFQTMEELYSALYEGGPVKMNPSQGSGSGRGHGHVTGSSQGNTGNGRNQGNPHEHTNRSIPGRNIPGGHPARNTGNTGNGRSGNPYMQGQGNAPRKKNSNTGLKVIAGVLGVFLIVLLVVILLQLKQIRSSSDTTETESSKAAAVETSTPVPEKTEKADDSDTEDEDFTDTEKADAKDTEDADTKDINGDTDTETDAETVSKEKDTEADSGETASQKKTDSENKSRESKKTDKAAAKATATPAPTDTPVPTVVPEPVLQTDAESLDYVRNNYIRLTEDDVAGADSSSMIQQDNTDNLPIYLFREDDQTNWQEGVDGPGIGQYVAYTLKQTYEIEAMSFRLGNWKTDRYFWGNNRPKTLEIIADSNSWTITFPDEYMTEYVVTFSQPIKATNLKFTINDVYKGSQWDDTVITEISLWHK